MLVELLALICLSLSGVDAYEVQGGSTDKDKLYDFLLAKNMLQTQGCATCETHAPTPSPTPPPTFSAGTWCTLSLFTNVNFGGSGFSKSWMSATSDESQIVSTWLYWGHQVELNLISLSSVKSLRIAHSGPADLFPNKACCVRIWYSDDNDQHYDVCSTKTVHSGRTECDSADSTGPGHKRYNLGKIPFFHSSCTTGLVDGGSDANWYKVCYGKNGNECASLLS